MGINLDGDIVRDIPECGSGHMTGSDLCREKSYSPRYVELDGVPPLGLSYHVALGALLKGSRIESLSLTGNTRDFDKLSQIFISKYGQPTESSSTQVKTKSGASFQNDILRWSGVRVSILLTRYADDINTYAAMVTNKAVASAAAQDDAKKISDGASKL